MIPYSTPKLKPLIFPITASWSVSQPPPSSPPQSPGKTGRDGTMTATHSKQAPERKNRRLAHKICPRSAVKQAFTPGISSHGTPLTRKLPVVDEILNSARTSRTSLPYPSSSTKVMRTGQRVSYRRNSSRRKGAEQRRPSRFPRNLFSRPHDPFDKTLRLFSMHLFNSFIYSFIHSFIYSFIHSHQNLQRPRQRQSQSR